MTGEKEKKPGMKPAAAAATISTIAAGCGVCCVLPFALPAAALAWVGGILAWFAQAHQLLSGIAMLAVRGAWARVLFQSYKAKAAPARSTLVVLSGASAMLALALLWPRLEPAIIAAMSG